MTEQPNAPAADHEAPSHRGHGWMMIACCIPMLAIGALLVATGVVESSFLVVAVACTAMMALMMRAMNHGGSDQTGDDSTTHAGHGRQDDR